MFSLLICLLIGAALGYVAIVFLGWILYAVVDIIDTIIKVFTGGY